MRAKFLLAKMAHARSAETLKKRRENEKERRSKKCTLSEDVMGDMFKWLEEDTNNCPAGTRPKFAQTARFDFPLVFLEHASPRHVEN